MRGEYNRLLKGSRGAEKYSGAYFHAILRVDEDDAGICYVKGCDGVSYEVVGARTVDYIEFLAKEFGVKNGREY